MSVAVLWDVPGVLPVLEAVLAEPDVIAADPIVLTGDIVTGPQPVAVLDCTLGRGVQVLLVRGNADRDIVALARGELVDHPFDTSVGYWVYLRAGNVSLRRTVMDANSVVEQTVAGSTYPDRRAWADEYVRAVTSAAEASTVFAPGGRSAARS